MKTKRRAGFQPSALNVDVAGPVRARSVFRGRPGYHRLECRPAIAVGRVAGPPTVIGIPVMAAIVGRRRLARGLRCG